MYSQQSKYFYNLEIVLHLMSEPDKIISEAKKIVAKYDKSKYETSRREKKSISFKTTDKISLEMHEEASKNDLSLKEYLIALHRTRKGKKIAINQEIAVKKSKISIITALTIINSLLLIILIIQTFSQ